MKLIKYFFQKQSIVIKQFIVIISICLVILLLLDIIQNKQLTVRMSENLNKELKGLAHEHRLGFDNYIQSIHNSVKLISSLKRFVDYINHYQAGSGKDNSLIYFADKPPNWLPKTSILRGFYRARLALLISPENDLLSAYYNRVKVKADNAISNQTMQIVNHLKSKYLLRKLVHNQSYMTQINNIPYLISSELRNNQNGKGFMLILLTPLDNQFLADILSAYYHKDKGITVLINSENDLVISSSEASSIKTGENIHRYAKQYLFAGTSFFDYGSSDLRVQFASVIPITDVNKTFKNEILEFRKQKLLLAMVLVIGFILIIYTLIYRIKALTQYIYNIQQSKFNVIDSVEKNPNPNKGDEIFILYNQFNLLIKNIEQNQKILQCEILERKSKEKELSLAKNKADKANLAKTEFLSSMSHELRTPLNAILGFSELLTFDKSLSPLQLKNSQEIYNSGSYLLSLVNDLLDLSRIEEGRLNLHLKKVNINELLEECYQLISPMAKKENITIYYDHSINNSDLITVDYTRLKQVVLNLLSNSIKYHSPIKKPKIWLNSSIEGNQLIISVKDNGLGIEKEKFHKLFEPFNRLGAEKGHIEGTGIGLVISKKLIALMQGNITVENSSEKGACFRIHLPLNENNHEP
jgi:signal transduction histidine kinase